MSATAGPRVDPITVAVIGGALTSIAVDMGYRLTRMSYSSIIRESEDFGCAIVDHERRQLCESTQSTPLQSGPLQGYIEGIDRRFAEVGDAWRPGDVVIHNHPYYGASHQPDIAIVIPVFLGEELIGFSATTAHHLDLGALTPGTCGIVEAADAFAEGLLLNAVKVEEAGRTVTSAWRIIADNTRLPKLVLGDLEAQVAAARLGEIRLLELVERYGLETVRAASEVLMDQSEAALRQQIEALPDGRYEATGTLDGFLDHPDPRYRELPIAVAITVEGSDMHVDLTGTAEQVDLPINMPLIGTVDIAILLTIRAILLDTRHHPPVQTNAGLFRPITFHAPEGSLANPTFPAPTIARFCPGNIVADTVMRALSQVRPDAVSAGVGNLKVISFSGRRNGQAWVYMDIVEGSYGGRAEKDGLDAVDTLYANTRNNPVEDIESHYPLRVRRYELAEGGGGAGRTRGGLGSIREFEFLDEGGVSVEGDGSATSPPGLFGGGSGTPGAITLNPDGDRQELPSMAAFRKTRPGDVLRLTAPSGGGYGIATKREPELVREDVRRGFLDADAAATDYGVVLGPAPGLEIDPDATAERRTALRAQEA
ncbi:MAG: hydantoinase B/oxoprolinase family protein [Solirubrobacteraceae bacterium]|nr:hydantoinase B/oxoprolinase family protein [Solirubrobacteraceae bacterium]